MFKLYIFMTCNYFQIPSACDFSAYDRECDRMFLDLSDHSVLAEPLCAIDYQKYFLHSTHHAFIW